MGLEQGNTLPKCTLKTPNNKCLFKQNWLYSGIEFRAKHPGEKFTSTGPLTTDCIPGTMVGACPGTDESPQLIKPAVRISSQALPEEITEDPSNSRKCPELTDTGTCRVREQWVNGVNQFFGERHFPSNQVVNKASGPSSLKCEPGTMEPICSTGKS